MVFSFIGITHCLTEIACKEGIHGLYLGVFPTLLAIVPFMAVQQASYDVMKQYISELEITPSASVFFVCGGFAGAAAQTVSFNCFLVFICFNTFNWSLIYIRIYRLCIHWM